MKKGRFLISMDRIAPSSNISKERNKEGSGEYMKFVILEEGEVILKHINRSMISNFKLEKPVGGVQYFVMSIHRQIHI